VAVIYGVDGCKGGWFFIRLEGDAVSHGTVRTLAELVEAAQDNSKVFVDIPIGLQDTTGSRQCDVEARRLLGSPRCSSVFSAPIRAILGEPDYAAANAASKRLSGKGLSQQAYAITPKIKEVDDLLRTDPRLRGIVREVHPELCFYGFAGRPMQYGKKPSAGFDERMAVLRELRPDTDVIVEDALATYLRKVVARDDILDALVAAITGTVGMRTVPDQPEVDSCGLPMEMVYPR
jgi:predicted RNase H-like nuclease